MENDEKTVLDLLLALKIRHGDLNSAMVRAYVMVHGSKAKRKIAQDLGVNRSVVHRALQNWSENDHFLSKN